MKLPSLLRPIMLAGALGCGLLVPELAQLTFAVPWILFMMVWVVALQIDIKMLMPTRTHLYFILAHLALGLIPALVLHALGYHLWGNVAFFIGMTPTATAASVVMSFLGGRVPYVITAFFLDNIIISVLMIFILPVMFSGSSAHVSIGDVLLRLTWIMLLPLSLGLLMQTILPRITATLVRYKRCNFFLWISTLMILSSNAAAFCKNQDTPTETLIWVGVISGVFCAVNFLVGAWVGGREMRREMSQSLGQKNTLYTTYLALAYANPLVALGPIFYIFFHNLWNAIQLYNFEKK